MSNLAEKFSNYSAFRFHFGDLVIEKVGRNDYVAMRPGPDSCEDWLQRGTKEYINGWLYGAVQTICGQIHKEPADLPEGDKQGICPVCGAEIEYHDNIKIDDGGVYEWTCPSCGASGEEGYDEVFDGHHYNVTDADGNKIPGREGAGS